MKWTEREVALLKMAYVRGDPIINMIPGRTVAATINKASRLGLKRPLECTSDRFWRQVNVMLNDCWLWASSTFKNGYGQFHFNGQPEYAHRFAYREQYGDIPEGMTIHHHCGNKRCVNPDHLECMTRGDNLRQPDHPTGKNLRKTHCKRGHSFDFKNTHITKSLSRVCRKCHAQREAERRRNLS